MAAFYIDSRGARWTVIAFLGADDRDPTDPRTRLNAGVWFCGPRGETRYAALRQGARREPTPVDLLSSPILQSLFRRSRVVRTP
ncbi:MAG: hypothetical protein NVS1B4_01340 [Gemmatimonadaceae bacterium]